jgi:hypothetical protein
MGEADPDKYEDLGRADNKDELKQRSKRTNEKSNQLKLSSTSLWAL